MYGVQCDILSRDADSQMNARTTLSNGMTVKGNGSGTAVVRATQNNFEVILKIRKCV
jgi:hypothetical protein